MKKGFMLGLMFFGMLGICSQASAENIFAGKVAASDTSVISAPYGGRVDNIYVHIGDYVGEDSLIATLGTDEVYALVDGTVSGIFASEGDDAESVAERYGAVLFIEPTNRFTLDCSNEKGYSYSENRYIHIGETVYLSCTTDGSHSGVGVVTGVDEKDEKKFSVEVTEGLFYMNESVGVFRNPQYTSMSRIGRGTVVRTAAVAAKAVFIRYIRSNTIGQLGEEYVLAAKAKGSVLKMHVKNGDHVERGQLLFETVTGSLKDLQPTGSEVMSDVEGIVASVDAKKGAKVEKGDALITVYPKDEIQIEILISEADLPTIRVGETVSIEFNWSMEHEDRQEGVITSISYINQTDEKATGTTYKAYINFEPDENIRLGMTAIVYAQ